MVLVMFSHTSNTDRQQTKKKKETKDTHPTLFAKKFPQNSIKNNQNAPYLSESSRIYVLASSPHAHHLRTWLHIENQIL